MDFGPSGGLWLRSSVLGPQPSFPQSPCHDPALVSWIVSIYLYMIRCCTEHLAIEVMYLVKEFVGFVEFIILLSRCDLRCTTTNEPDMNKCILPVFMILWELKPRTYLISRDPY